LLFIVILNPEEMGIIVETTVLRHLYAYYYRDTPEISYWRDAATNREVDIIKNPAYHLPFAVKYKEKAPPRPHQRPGGVQRFGRPGQGLSDHKVRRRPWRDPTGRYGYPVSWRFRPKTSAISSVRRNEYCDNN